MTKCRAGYAIDFEEGLKTLKNFARRKVVTFCNSDYKLYLFNRDAVLTFKSLNGTSELQSQQFV